MGINEAFAEVCKGILDSSRQVDRLVSASNGNPENVQGSVRMMVRNKVRAKGFDWTNIDEMLDYNEAVAELISDVADAVWSKMDA